MAESTEHLFYPRAINATLSGAGSAQVIIPIQGRRTVSLATLSTGTLAGTVAAWTSGNYIDPLNGDPAGVTAAEARADWNALTSGLANPAGSPVDSRVVLSVCDAAIRIRITWSSGSGLYVLHFNAQAF